MGPFVAQFGFYLLRFWGAPGHVHGGAGGTTEPAVMHACVAEQPAPGTHSVLLIFQEM